MVEFLGEDCGNYVYLSGDLVGGLEDSISICWFHVDVYGCIVEESFEDGTAED